VTERQTAFHEAGHCVCAAQYALSLRTVFVHQRRNPDGEAGRTELVSFVDCIDSDPFRALVYVCAGPAAERRFTGRSDAGDLRDREQATAIASIIHEHKPADHPAIARTVAHAELIARANMLDPVVWAAVEAVAKALEQKKRLTGREVLQLVRQTCQVRA
jgi:hypothetical protein